MNFTGYSGYWGSDKDAGVQAEELMISNMLRVLENPVL